MKLREKLEDLLHEKYNLIPTDKVQMAIDDIIKIINIREKGTNKTREAEQLVDWHWATFGHAPTYREVQLRLKLKSVNSAYFRLRNYRYRMMQSK